MSKKPRRIKLPESADPRLVCLFILRRWEEGDRKVDELLSEMLESAPLETRDRGLLQEILFGIIRNRGRIDYLLDCLLSKGLGSIPAIVRDALRIGAYQILFSDRIPDYAAINETVQMLKELQMKGMAGLANAVLRRLAEHHHTILLPDASRNPVEHLSVAYSFPQWLVERFLDQWGREDATTFMQRANEVPDLYIRTNTLKTNTDELLMRLETEGVAAYRHDRIPNAIRLEARDSLRKVGAFREGLCQVQAPASQLVAPLVAPREGQIVLDACAAPGGKTTHLVELIGGVAGVIAVDRNETRMRLVRQNLKRMDMMGVVTHAARVDANINFLLSPVDAVLVDAPCSGLGVLQRRPDLRWRLKPQDIPDLARKQLAMLEDLDPWLVPGGTLVYSTCTLTPEENRSLVRTFLSRNPGYRIDPPHPYLPESVHACIDADGFLETLPHRDRLDGTFAVRLIKGR